MLADQLLSLVGLGSAFDFDLKESFFTEIETNVFLGAKPTPTRIQELKGVGITHVVSCLPENKRPEMGFVAEHFQHLFLGLRDHTDQDISEAFPAFFEFVEALTRGRSTAKVLVHCEVGVSRSPTLVIAWFMKRDNLSFFDAFLRVRSQRFQVLPNIGFASQLQRLEHELQPNSLRRSPSSLARYLHQICNAPVELEVLQSALERHQYDAPRALRLIFGEIPRVVQGVRS